MKVLDYLEKYVARLSCLTLKIKKYVKKINILAYKCYIRKRILKMCLCSLMEDHRTMHDHAHRSVDGISYLHSEKQITVWAYLNML